jgi:hypothetical protein
MKLNGISKDDSSVSTQGRPIRRFLGMLGAALLVMLLNRCASVRGSGAPDPWHYNPSTGYSAVGGPCSGRF